MDKDFILGILLFGIIYLMANDYAGWGWLIFLFILVA